MEQLYLPKDAPLRSKLVKYEGYNDFHETSFFEYPSKHGCEFLISVYGVSEIDKLNEWRQQREAQCSPFLQTWLYCSLLREFFNIAYKHEDFVRVDAKTGDLVYCTATLSDSLKLWGRATLITSEDQKKLMFNHYNLCFKTVTSVLASTGDKIPNGALQVICCTVENLHQLVRRAFSQANQDFLARGGWSQSSWHKFCQWTEGELEQMVRLGWCKSEAYQMLESTTSLQTRLYLSNLSRREREGYHIACTLNSCVAGDKLQTPRHCREDCQCNMLQLEDQQLLDVKILLNSNRMYVLELGIDTNDQLTIRPVAWDDGQCYVAISHVWSDGMGNPNDNALPECQLRFVYQSVQQTRVFPQSSITVRVWIDTICCPIERTGKLVVLARMREIYEKARCVLVLDSELEKVHVNNINSTESMARIICSRWTTRLWTLQESFLARNLVFCFAEGVGSLESFTQTNEHTVGLAHHHIYLHLKTQYKAQRKFPHDEAFRSMRQLSFLKASLPGRYVTMAEDEALCLATLVDLPPDVVEKLVHTEDRMALFWTEYCRLRKSLPLSLLFFGGPKISRHGLRWAPKSLLQASRFTNMILETGYEEKQTQGYLSPQGLCFQSQGCLIRPGTIDRDLEMLWDLKPKHTQNTESSRLRDSTGRWYHLTGTDLKSDVSTGRPLLVSETTDANYIERHPQGALRTQLQTAVSGQEEYCLFLSQPLPSFVKREGKLITASLLCETIGTTNEHRQGKPSRIVLLSPVDRHNSMIWNLAYKITEEFRSTNEQYVLYKTQSTQGQDGASGPSMDEISLSLANSLLKSVHLALRQETDLKAEINKDENDNSALIRVFHATREMLADYFHFNIEILPEDQKWCIG